MAWKISKNFGSTLACSLGTYLAVALLRKKVHKSTYLYVVEKVQIKLSLGENIMLSKAGRLTLIKCFASALPVYAVNCKSPYQYL